jgi:hypothetical protein
MDPTDVDPTDATTVPLEVRRDVTTALLIAVERACREHDVYLDFPARLELIELCLDDIECMHAPGPTK